MPFTSDREALRALVDAPDDAALREAVCVHLLSPDPALARLRRSLADVVSHAPAAPVSILHHVRALLQETAR